MKKYNKFFWKFWKEGYISEPTRLASGQLCFWFEFDSVIIADQAREFCTDLGFKVVKSSLRPELSGMVIIK